MYRYESSTKCFVFLQSGKGGSCSSPTQNYNCRECGAAIGGQDKNQLFGSGSKTARE